MVKYLRSLLLFTMLFNGGWFPSYMVNTQLLGLRGFGVGVDFPHVAECPFMAIVLRTFFKEYSYGNYRSGPY